MNKGFFDLKSRQKVNFLYKISFPVYDTTPLPSINRCLLGPMLLKKRVNHPINSNWDEIARTIFQKLYIQYLIDPKFYVFFGSKFL